MGVRGVSTLLSLDDKTSSTLCICGSKGSYPDRYLSADRGQLPESQISELWIVPCLSMQLEVCT